ncbi:MAG: 5-methylcytosine-specific restriction endonuclease system specificity protein McrC [Prevotellaceae bacterium]|nr:5-methylcytosine-specific restriction endonuclease system specificity protein McrC [Prevotellaceae bacterium]
MIKDKSILIRNIYYMLSCAFEVLQRENYEPIASEAFDHIHDLFAEILYKGISSQLKRGLHREYVAHAESLPTLKGRLEMRGTIGNVMSCRRELNCLYDEFSENNPLNRILKATLYLLLRNPDVTHARRAKLRYLLPFFKEVDETDIHHIRWDSLVYHRNNQTYPMLMNVCRFIIESMLLTTEGGAYRMATFRDERMSRLFEHFVLAYYRTHHKALSARADEIAWNIDQDAPAKIAFLPKMQSDIVLHGKHRALVIDTKYYGKSMQQYYDKPTIHSHNLYQIFTYVKNMDAENSGKVSGMLLYAKTDEEITPDLDATIGQNRFMVKTLDLNTDFNDIKKQLDAIAACIDHQDSLQPCV